MGHWERGLVLAGLLWEQFFKFTVLKAKLKAT